METTRLTTDEVNESFGDSLHARLFHMLAASEKQLSLSGDLSGVRLLRMRKSCGAQLGRPALLACALIVSYTIITSCPIQIENVIT